jgi:hypothetical protein
VEICRKATHEKKAEIFHFGGVWAQLTAVQRCSRTFFNFFYLLVNERTLLIFFEMITEYLGMFP